MGRFLPHLTALLFEDYCRTHDIPPPDSSDPDILYDLAYPVYDPLYPPRGSLHAPEPTPDDMQATTSTGAALNVREKRRRKGPVDTAPRQSRRS